MHHENVMFKPEVHYPLPAPWNLEKFFQMQESLERISFCPTGISKEMERLRIKNPSLLEFIQKVSLLDALSEMYWEWFPEQTPEYQIILMDALFSLHLMKTYLLKGMDITSINPDLYIFTEECKLFNESRLYNVYVINDGIFHFLGQRKTFSFSELSDFLDSFEISHGAFMRHYQRECESLCRALWDKETRTNYSLKVKTFCAPREQEFDPQLWTYFPLNPVWKQNYMNIVAREDHKTLSSHKLPLPSEAMPLIFYWAALEEIQPPKIESYVNVDYHRYCLEIFQAMESLVAEFTPTHKLLPLQVPYLSHLLEKNVAPSWHLLPEESLTKKVIDIYHCSLDGTLAGIGYSPMRSLYTSVLSWKTKNICDPDTHTSPLFPAPRAAVLIKDLREYHNTQSKKLPHRDLLSEFSSEFQPNGVIKPRMTETLRVTLAYLINVLDLETKRELLKKLEEYPDLCPEIKEFLPYMSLIQGENEYHLQKPKEEECEEEVPETFSNPGTREKVFERMGKYLDSHETLFKFPKILYNHFFWLTQTEPELGEILEWVREEPLVFLHQVLKQDFSPLRQVRLFAMFLLNQTDCKEWKDLLWMGGEIFDSLPLLEQEINFSAHLRMIYRERMYQQNPERPVFFLKLMTILSEERLDKNSLLVISSTDYQRLISVVDVESFIQEHPVVIDPFQETGTISVRQILNKRTC